jgi:hypothetical protein
MANHGVVVCVNSERLPIRESDVAGLAAAKVIIDGAHQTLATNPSSMYGSRGNTARAILCLSGVRVVDAELLSPRRTRSSVVCLRWCRRHTWPPSLLVSGASSSKPK